MWCPWKVIGKETMVECDWDKIVAGCRACTRMGRNPVESWNGKAKIRRMSLPYFREETHEQISAYKTLNTTAFNKIGYESQGPSICLCPYFATPPRPPSQLFARSTIARRQSAWNIRVPIASGSCIFNSFPPLLNCHSLARCPRIFNSFNVQTASIELSLACHP